MYSNLSIEKYKGIYNRLNVSFDIYSGESQFQKQMVEVMEALQVFGTQTVLPKNFRFSDICL